MIFRSIPNKNSKINIYPPVSIKSGHTLAIDLTCCYVLGSGRNSYGRAFDILKKTIGVCGNMNFNNNYASFNGGSPSSIDLTGIDRMGGDYSVVFYIRPSQVDGGFNDFSICRDWSGTNRNYLIRIVSSQIQLLNGDGATSQEVSPLITTGNLIGVNKWVYVVATRKDRLLSIYLNGILNAQTTGVYDGGPTFNNVYFGADNTKLAGYGFYGRASYFYYYKRALSPKEVAILYANPFIFLGTNSNKYFFQLSSGSINATATPSLATATILSFQPSVSFSQSQIASPSLASVSITPFTAVETFNSSNTALPSLSTASITAFQATASFSGQGTVTALPSLASMSIEAQTATDSFYSNAIASPSLSTSTILSYQPSISFSQSQIALPSLSIASITTFTATASTNASITASPSVSFLSILLNNPTVSFQSSRIASPSLSSISINPFTATATSGITGAVTIPYRLESLMEKQINKESRINKYINIESTLVN